MLVITPKILDKLYYKHGIADGFKMARLALNNINGNLLVDTREKNIVKGMKTEWCVVKVEGKFYKVVFLRFKKDVVLKTMFEIKEVDRPFTIYASQQSQQTDVRTTTANNIRKMLKPMIKGNKSK